MTGPLLSVSGLRTTFDTPRGVITAVDGIDFEINRGETVCLVGESGSGKTVACESITRLIASPPGEITDGRVVFDGQNVLDCSSRELREIHGNKIAYVFQNPQNALDPVYTVGAQVAESVQFHQDVSDGVAKERAIDLLDRVGIPKAEVRSNDYPHEFSGGMRQRVVIAMALAGEPDLLIADEPTTALDVTIEAQILDLLRDLQDERDMAILFVTHDLGVVAEIADRVVVMYAGKVMERGDVRAIFDQPSHPYTQALLACLPGQGNGLQPIGGSMADPISPPAGCRFHPRCPHAIDTCARNGQPPLQGVRNDQKASCIFHRSDRDSSVVLDETERESGEAEEAGDAERTRGNVR
ncbi:peptide/nickel transport system ATP-binding protein [Haladaptatus litoreus]|uniref:Nickel import system ATP-binding protein NikD n=1 Tax=Haladaptatus litoreus TaxID=553468 RepID=A0A1N7C3W4_9EURY|nr:ABC transporter ATP-binding protein [Haladaptatus litoreus]SIR58268.1 peptide/nickel transport system ATP-binding protein [Haladaptatus litoreus]